MKVLLLIILIIISTSVTAKERTQASVCILSFFKKQSREHRLVLKVFKNHKYSRIVLIESTKDIEKCFKDTYEEIIWVGHTTSNIFADGTPQFVYYKGKKSVPIYGRVYQNLLKMLYLQAREGRITKKFRIAGCGVGAFSKGRIYNFLEELNKLGVEIEISPTRPILSAIAGHPVTSLRGSWLVKSADCNDGTKWGRRKSMYCPADFNQ
ncbi:MAG: hypothetical protein KAQ98_04530 [Bacteriovoracaceae bacterium]|nr:hypothetical protein [Bacteriovoracaceae bacterium]